jgi:hypothetical protein
MYHSTESLPSQEQFTQKGHIMPEFELTAEQKRRLAWFVNIYIDCTIENLNDGSANLVLPFHANGIRVPLSDIQLVDMAKQISSLLHYWFDQSADILAAITNEE